MTFETDAMSARTHDRFVTHSPKWLAVVALVMASVAACERGPVEWRGEAVQLALAAEDEETAAPLDARLELRPDGSAGLHPIAAALTSPAAADTAACASSLRTAALSPTEVYGVWWSRRAGGRAALVAARSDDGGVTWIPPVPVDTTDRGAIACGRPDPAIAADARSGYVHVTYFLHGPNGPGVFFSHSMERGELFHAPVPIMYGERPAQTAVAAGDSVVVVAFEDPNSKRPRVALAMSRTWGHIFARERPEASNGETPAVRPLIALRDSVIAVGWHGVDGSIAARIGAIR
jgi:hypothetical protein